MTERRVQIDIKGIVQGVFFRASTVDVATAIGLKGWVKNQPNGTVKIVAEGNKEGIIKLYDWCKVGPKNAVVDSVDIKWESAKNEFTDFKIIN